MVDTALIMQAARQPDVNLPDILQRSAQSAAAIENLPLQREAMQIQNQQGQLMNRQRQGAIDEDERAGAVRKAGLIYNYVNQLKNLPMEQRRTFIATIPQETLQDIGFDPKTIGSLAIDDASLATTAAQLEPIVQRQQGQQAARRSESLAGGRITAQELSDGTVRYLEYGQEIPADQVRDRVTAANTEYAQEQETLSRSRRGGALGAEDEFKPKTAAKVARETEKAKDVQEFIAKAVPQIGKIKSNIGTYDDAIAAIDAGANTGKITSYLPTFKEASIDLENIRGRLGLDVISMGSFGALSEGELRMALSTALPNTKSPEALREWLVNKQAAQTKAASALEDAVLFLDQGNSLADLVAESRLRKETGYTAETPPPAGAPAPAQTPEPAQTQQPQLPPADFIYNVETGLLE